MLHKEEVNQCDSVLVMNDYDIIEKSESFFYYDDSFAEAIEHWALQRCETFSADPRISEQPIINQQLFAEYCQHFETILEGFLSHENITLSDFFGSVRREYDRAAKKKQEGSTFCTVLLSSIDFFNFCELMYNVKLGQGVVFCPPLIDIVALSDSIEHEEFGSCSKDIDDCYDYKSDDKIYYK